MIQIDAPWSVILLELTGVMIVLCLLLGVRASLRRRKEWAAANKLVAALKGEQEARRQEIRSLLASKYGYHGDQLNEKATAISRAEWRFYQTLINIYLKRDAESVVSLHRAFAEATDPYYRLEVLAAPAAQPAKPPPEPPPEPQQEIRPAAPRPSAVPMNVMGGVEALDDFAEMQHLREENERLSEELQITMGTISRMLSEYSSIVGRGGADEGGDDFMDMFNEDSAG